MPLSPLCDLLGRLYYVSMDASAAKSQGVRRTFVGHLGHGLAPVRCADRRAVASGRGDGPVNAGAPRARDEHPHRLRERDRHLTRGHCQAGRTT